MTLAETLQMLKTSALQVKTDDKAVLLKGTDVLSWLQGQITQDITQLESQRVISACICNPKGQIQTTLTIHQQSESEFIAILPKPEVLIERVENFVIMEDVSAKLVGRPLFSIQGKGSKGHFSNDRTGYGGFDTFDTSDLPIIPQDHLSAFEIAAGIPRFGFEISPKTLPPELGDQFEKQNISYTKGCYVGQEVIHRIHARGHTNKTWVGLIADQPFQGPIVVNNDQAVGAIYRSAQHPVFGFIASATLKNEAAVQGTQVQIGGITATVKLLPLLRHF